MCKSRYMQGTNGRGRGGKKGRKEFNEGGEGGKERSRKVYSKTYHWTSLSEVIPAFDSRLSMF